MSTKKKPSPDSIVRQILLNNFSFYIQVNMDFTTLLVYRNTNCSYLVDPFLNQNPERCKPLSSQRA